MQDPNPNLHLIITTTRLAIRRLPDQLKPLAILSFLVACLSVLAYVFNLFAPVVYGHDEDDAKFSNSSLHHLHLLDQWDFWDLLNIQKKYMCFKMIRLFGSEVLWQIGPPPLAEMLAKMKESGISHYMPLYIGVLCSWTTLGLLVGMNACIYEMLKLGYLFMSKSPDLWCLSRDLVCKFFAPLTVLIPNCIYRCDIIHRLVRYHGRAGPSRELMS